MKKITRFVIWLCSKFTREEIEQIIIELASILADRDPKIKPKDDFKEKHPNYRNFFVDPNPPLTSPTPQETKPPTLDMKWKTLLNQHLKNTGHPLLPVHFKEPKNKPPKDAFCRHCGAPSEYLYFNDGKKQSQLKCKVCSGLSHLPHHERHPSFKTGLFCPHCGRPLFLWKRGLFVRIYKCDNDNCPEYLRNLNNLNPREKALRKLKPSQFKLHYQFREYLFSKKQLLHSSPAKPSRSAIFKIRNSFNTLCLALTFHISLGLSARKTAFVLRNVFGIRISYQSVLNYTQHAAYFCHKFNLAHKGQSDNTQVGDETYIKVSGKNHYTFFFISPSSRAISSYHIADSRGTLTATAAMNEAIRTTDTNSPVTLISDGNPSYAAGILFLNSHRDKLSRIFHKKVIGLQNLDSVSEEFRPLKQLIERLNRTYKFHTKAAHGFASLNGAIALTTLFVSYYNFIRPHSARNYASPIPLPELRNIPSIQGKWAKILQLAFPLATAA